MNDKNERLLPPKSGKDTRKDNRTMARYIYYPNGESGEKHVITDCPMKINIITELQKAQEQKWYDLHQKAMADDKKQLEADKKPLEDEKKKLEAEKKKLADEKKTPEVEKIKLAIKIVQEEIEAITKKIKPIAKELNQILNYRQVAHRDILGGNKVYLINVGEIPRYKNADDTVQFALAMTTTRPFACDVAVASLLGAILSTGYVDLSYNGGCTSDGSASPSTSHGNGRHLDLKYLGLTPKPGKRIWLNRTKYDEKSKIYGWTEFDVERQNIFNEKAKLFGWRGLLGWELWNYKSTKKPWNEWHERFEKDKWLKWHEKHETCKNEIHTQDNCKGAPKTWCINPNTPEYSKQCKHIMDTDHVKHWSGHYHHIHLQEYMDKKKLELAKVTILSEMPIEKK